MNSLSKEMARARIEDIQRDARLARTGAARRNDDRPAVKPLARPITIRRATVDDDAAVRRVAELDSSQVPAAPLLLAEVDGEVRAAVSLADGAFVADPFHYTAAIVELLDACAAHEPMAHRSRLRRRWRRTLRRSDRRAARRVTSGPVEAVR